MDRVLLFVYGTLKRDHGNNRLLYDSKYLGPATCKGMLLTDLGPFPAGNFTDGRLSDITDPVTLGELYAINNSTLRAVDRLEGSPDFYVRNLVSVYDEKDVEKVAYTYILPDVSKYPVVPTNEEGQMYWY